MVSSRAPSVQRSKALRADALLANSTRPFPVGRPRSSVTTTARSTGPNWENAWGSEGSETMKIIDQISRFSWRDVPQTLGGGGVTGLVHLFQQLVCDNRQKVPHSEGGAVRGEADPDWPVTQERPVQLGLSDLCQCPRFLEENKQTQVGYSLSFLIVNLVA